MFGYAYPGQKYFGQAGPTATTYTQAVGGTLSFNGTVSLAAIFNQAVTGSLSFVGTLASSLIFGAAGASNIIRRFLQRH